jgi:hypothetical protein
MDTSIFKSKPEARVDKIGQIAEAATGGAAPHLANYVD